MSHTAKRLVVGLLRPAAMVVEATEPLRRAWIHARFAVRLRTPIPASVIALGLPEVHGTGRIRVGEDLYLYRDLYFETQEQGSISIGLGVVMSRGVHVVSFARIEIGDGCMIGEYASLRDANHRLGTGRALRYSGYDASPIVLGREVWIGRGAIVLPGVTIGDGAVVGANAVVTKDVPAGSVVVGVPARPLARRSGNEGAG